ncbi:DUF4286 family protein [Saccharicrinis aurantiacus]|uniref:DUF4286 family protein n=1 Tax=Saccharicrinis aurantiacus TaxID=1849719 RepID=UPI0009503557|nr:DUF4286 family protein [Saccharicrinis aurantiacus]
MFVFNTTFVVTVAAFEKWHAWQKGTYMPLLKNLLPGAEVKTFEVLSADQQEGRTLSVQWRVATPTDLEVLNKQSPVVLGQMASEFGSDALFFSSILKEI